MIATPIVAAITAIGTFFSGLSTASLLAQALSRPRKAHSVMEMEAPTALKKGSLCGFHASTYMVGLNQNQPITDRARTGRMAHQTATEENLPVMEAPMKLAAVQTQRTAMVETHTATGESSMPKNSEP